MQSSSPSRESLVDLVFGKLALTYGRDFTGRWEGIDIAEVKADWVRELGFYLDRPETIKFALEHLSNQTAPTVLHFRALCNSHNPPKPKELPAPKASRAAVEQAMAKVGKGDEAVDPRAWAYRMKEADASGARLTPTQRAMYRAVTDPARGVPA